MCTLCDSTNINTIIEFVPNCLLLEPRQSFRITLYINVSNEWNHIFSPPIASKDNFNLYHSTEVTIVTVSMTITKPSTNPVTDISRGTSCGNNQEGEVFSGSAVSRIVPSSETESVPAQNSLTQCS